jgi:hypothetical protein
MAEKLRQCKKLLLNGVSDQALKLELSRLELGTLETIYKAMRHIDKDSYRERVK